jgi:hypothetical protein
MNSPESLDDPRKEHTTMTELSLLREVLTATAAETGRPLKDFTVLADQNDPYRLDTPARHRDGEWLAIIAREHGLGDRQIHLRGLHYMILSAEAVKPDGNRYTNTDKDWEWLQGTCAKAARFLGYIPFDQIVDQRNAEPVIREFEPPEPSAYFSTEIEVEIPYDAEPVLEADEFRGTQPYKLVMIGEKSSLEPVLAPVAETYEADLYLPTGEISDTQVYRIASVAARDSRPLVVLYFADCDPAGWQMGISVARKLQAFKVLIPGMPDFEMHRVALTPDHVREYGLPVSPLKDTEKRADGWRAAWGVEQTEIDALAALRPELLDQIARQALDGFWDRTLARRVSQYRADWLSRAREAIAATLDQDRLAGIRRDAEERLSQMRQEIRELNDQLRIDVDADDLPAIELPEAVDPGGNGLPLVDSRWPFAEQCRRLIASKSYQPEA